MEPRQYIQRFTRLPVIKIPEQKGTAKVPVKNTAIRMETKNKGGILLHTELYRKESRHFSTGIFGTTNSSWSGV